MHKIIDNFYVDLYCPTCNEITEHHVQKVDEEGDGQFIGYYAKCDVCDYIEEYSEEDLEIVGGTRDRMIKFIEDEGGNWKCDNCQEIWVLISGPPKENKYKYCPNCGRKIEEYVPYKETL